MRAPIIIPTLNRYEHLLRCIESLKKNTYANETEIYISLDYPPSDKYVEGYNKIHQYLKNNSVSGFKEMHIFYQQENLGPTENENFLRNEVYKKYDCFIFSEDDNEFSPNFLAYINKGLELFEDDDDILAICGYRNNKFWEFDDGNVTKIDMFHAWGYATWKDKIEKAREWINRNNYIRLLKSKSFCDKLYHTRKKVFHTFIEALLANPEDKSNVYITKGGDLRTMDYTLEVYMIASNKSVIIPKISLVRNWGYDGSGVNCGRIQDIRPIEQPIDDKTDFHYMVPSKFELNETNDRILTETEFDMKARTAKRYRVIMRVFGIGAGRKVYNAIYLLNSWLRKFE